MHDPWPNCGFRLLRKAGDGRLAVTDGFLRTYLHREELALLPESCAGERALHQRLLQAPAGAVTPAELDAISDPDARENYGHFLRFRDRLLAAGTIEACYAGLFADNRVDIPPSFVDHMCQLVVRSILDGTEDPLEARAAEMLFRPQSVTIRDGIALAADAAALDLMARTGGFGNIGRMMVESKAAVRGADLQVLTTQNAALYWMRGERFDTALPVSAGQPGAEALCRVLESWVRHFLGTPVSILPVPRIGGDDWSWHVGLDAEAASLLNELYRGMEVDDERLRRLLCLFELRFLDPQAARPGLPGGKVYLGMAMNADGILRLKPQNLLLNLPLARAG